MGCCLKAEKRLTNDEFAVLRPEGITEHGGAQTQEGFIPGEDAQLTGDDKDGEVIATLQQETRLWKYSSNQPSRLKHLLADLALLYNSHRRSHHKMFAERHKTYQNKGCKLNIITGKNMHLFLPSKLLSYHV